MKIASAAAMKEMDRFAIEEMGVPSLRLMENAAHAVAKQVCQLAGLWEGSVVIFSGAGNQWRRRRGMCALLNAAWVSGPLLSVRQPGENDPGFTADGAAACGRRRDTGALL